KLAIPDGAFALCAGTDFLFDADPDSEFAHLVEVPAGDYRVTVYSQLPGVNGEWHLRMADETVDLRQWFRATRPAEEVRAWLRSKFDEEGEKKDGPEVQEQPPVGFVIQLAPLGTGEALTLPPMDHNMLQVQEARKPARCPMGLPAHDLIKPEPPAACELGSPPEAVNVVDMMEDCAPAAWQGKPLPHRLEKLWQVYRVPFYCNDSVNCEIVVDGVEESDLQGWFPNHAAARCHWDEDRLRIGFLATMARWDLMQWLKDLGPALTKLPEGARLEMYFSDEDADEEGRQVWSGAIKKGNWEIKAVWPALSREEASELLAFSISIDGAKSIEARDKAEAEAVLDSVLDDVLFTESKVRREGLRLIPEGTGATLEQLARHVFQMRYEELLPMVPVVDEEEDFSFDLGGFGLSSPRYQAEMTEAFGSKGNEQTILRGRSGTFIAKTLDPLGPGAAPVFENADTGAAQYGWQVMGNLMVEEMPNMLMRAYTRAKADRVLVMYFTQFGPAGQEFFSHFDDGSSLTTTSVLGFEQDDPAKKIYRRRLRRALLDQLDRVHTEGIDERKATGANVLPAPATLEQLAEAVDEFLQRSAET
ncbi:MAG: hypothetical protein HYV26_10800, partial [Candidatus Hydrogenedentes bacterium]|nr:hypothetical protein [Candidatus Hydrogenedentota bacterium]